LFLSLGMLQSIAVFCGSSQNVAETYKAAAFELGVQLAKNEIRLVYGGAKVGLMGAVAEGALAQNGSVIGVIPDFLKTKEIAHEAINELIVVSNMHERKMKMHELSDGIIAMPGGWGTMEELFEMLTWAQLGLHTKPIGILNINGFYNDLLAMIDKMLQERFLQTVYRSLLLVHDDAATLLKMMNEYRAPELKQWLTNKTT